MLEILLAILALFCFNEVLFVFEHSICSRLAVLNIYQFLFNETHINWVFFGLRSSDCGVYFWLLVIRLTATLEEMAFSVITIWIKVW
jgi:hypothetical protein